MLFTKDILIKILKINFNYKIVEDDIFGEVIELDTRTAYRFCLTTNSYYLVDKYGLRLFGRFRTFNHRNFSLNPGLFLINTKTQGISDMGLPSKLFESYPFIFKGNKKIVFIESQNTQEVIAETLNKIIKSGKNNEDYILNLVHRNGAQWEHYFEFMASELFIEKGYLTDIQLPWSYHGRPDFGIYKHSLIKILESMDLIKNGALILELSALRIFKHINKTQHKLSKADKNKYEFMIGEVKSKQLKSQILEYLKTGLGFKGYEFIPNKKNRETFCGLIKIDEHNRIQIQEAPINKYMDQIKIQKDLEWFNCYIKIHLLGNLTLPEIKDLMIKNINLNKLTFSNLIKLVKKVELSKILEVI